MQEQSVRFQAILEKALEDFKEQLLRRYRHEFESTHGSLRQSSSSAFSQLLNTGDAPTSSPEASQIECTLGAHVLNVTQTKVDVSLHTNVVDFGSPVSNFTRRSHLTFMSESRSHPLCESEHEVDTILRRWAHLYRLLVKPGGFNAMLQQQKKLKIASFWVPYVTKLKEKDELCTLALSKAMVKIVDSRLNQLINLEKTPTAEFPSQYIPIHPDSHVSRMWLFASLAVVIYDVTVFPFAAFFDEDEDSVPMEASLWAIAIFWSVDIALSFITGRYLAGDLSMKLSRIRHNYFKTWFCFDLLLVITADWMQRFANLVDWSGGSGRYIRYVALARVLRIFKINSRLWKVSSAPIGVVLNSSLARISFLYVFVAHFVACLWFGIGRSTNGWASGRSTSDGSKRGQYDPHDVWHSYWTALHWSLSQMHGTSWLDHSTTAEKAFETIWLGCSFAVSCVFLAAVLRTTKSWSNRTGLLLKCARWAKVHGISSRVTRRAQEFLYASSFTYANTADRNIQLEAKLLQKFPQRLKEELLEQARKPLLTSMLFLKELGVACSRVVRSLCVEALQPVGAVSGETVFSSNDPSCCVRFIHSGRLVYSPCAGIRPSGSMSSRPTGLDEWAIAASASCKMTRVSAGCVLSEGTLWTWWQYCGDLVCTVESMIFELSSELFLIVLERRFEACLLAARHAERFVRFLKQTNHVSDLVDFQAPSDHTTRPTTPMTRAYYNHCIFISHYKVEAGTEATLLQDTFTDLLENHADLEYISSLVFLDSESLTDLSTLEQHVSQSDNLVVLLTPGLLTRPWCLIEIVTAFRNSVHIVPVEIVRPGMKFEYPSEEFYQQLLRRAILDDSAMKILGQYGIELPELVEAVRHVFEQIAEFFSPQRSKSVRGAEVDSILKRCCLTGKNVSFMNTPAVANMSHSSTRCFGRYESSGVSHRPSDGSYRSFHSRASTRSAQSSSNNATVPL